MNRNIPPKPQQNKFHEEVRRDKFNFLLFTVLMHGSFKLKYNCMKRFFQVTNAALKFKFWENQNFRPDKKCTYLKKTLTCESQISKNVV
jgi:hypothetical protein